jgi:hypothetical protein
MDPKKFLSSLQIPSYDDIPVPRSARSGIESDDEQKPAAYVDNQSLISFAAGVTGQNRKDVLNSTLLAQMVADHYVPDPEQMDVWYQKYEEVLRNIGWAIEKKEFSNFDSGHTAFEMQSAILDVLGTLVGANQLAMLTKTLDAIKKLGDSDGRIQIFERDVKEVQKGNFQIGMAEEVGGLVSMGMGAFMLKTKDEVNRVLFINTGKDRTSLKYYALKCTLHTDIYALVRNDILTKLGKAPIAFISKLPDFSF